MIPLGPRQAAQVTNSAGPPPTAGPPSRSQCLFLFIFSLERLSASRPVPRPRRESEWKIVTISVKQVRLINRRRREHTEEFQGKYRKRSGIESTSSLLKRVTGLGRLRVRGRRSVFMSIYLRVAGWNVLRAAAVRSVPEMLTKPGQTAIFAHWCRIFSLLSAFRSIAAA